MANIHEIPGRVTFLDGHGNLQKIEINTRWSDAEVYRHGAHITHFHRKGEAPLLFLSQVSRFAHGAAIRGGIPIIFPWFGPRDAQPTHGFARLNVWELKQIETLASGEVRLLFSLPESPEAALISQHSAEYSVTIGEKLTAELRVTNKSEQPFTFEDCLHTYFNVGDISAVSIRGLRGTEYLDKTEHFSRKTETNAEIKITSETDRVYLNTTSTVEIFDTKLRRKIIVEKSGSNSTVVWNPWITKAQQMPDFGNDEYQRMLCVESGNVGENKLTLAPGKTSSLKIQLSTAPL
jgi:D-hexose-6-phosphate mutarotase